MKRGARWSSCVPLLAAFVSGCAGADSTDLLEPAPPPVPMTAIPVPVSPVAAPDPDQAPDGPMPSADWCAAHRCFVGELTFAPGPGAEELVAELARRFALATGVDVHVDPAGIPVVLEDNLVNDDGSAPCARTEWARVEGGPRLVQRIALDPRPEPGWETRADGSCPPIAQSLMHEAIHALAPESDHAAQGLYAARAAGDGSIDLSALLKLCGEFPCALMRPEQKGSDQ